MSNYSYIISNNSSVTEAYNTSTKSVEFSNTNPTTVINSAIATNKGVVGLRNGTYEVDNNVLVKSGTGLIGESRDKTIIRTKAGFDENSIFRYWQGASSAPLEGFTLSNLKLELNVNNSTDCAWISSGTKDLTIDNIWVKSVKPPAVSTIGFFIDTANNTNNNYNTVVKNCIFEGSCLQQDFLGCGNLQYCDFSHNLFLNNTAQAIGVGGSFNSIISKNRFINIGTNAIGYEWSCENNLLTDNVCYNTWGIKLSGGWESNSVNYSRNNTCTNNVFTFGVGGIEAAISIDDVISGNRFYRTKRNGIQGSFLRTEITANIFTDTNYNNSSDRLIGNNTSVRTGGIIAFNSKSNMIPKNEWNVFNNNVFFDSGTSFSAPDNTTQQGFTNGVVIDTKYLNSIIKNNSGNLGNDMLKNYGTTAP